MPSNLFHHVYEPLSRLTIKSADDIAVLEAKEWYLPVLDSASKIATELKIGSVLEFRLCSEYELDAAGGFKRAQTTGSVHLRTALYQYTHIANVDYADSTSCGNPVVAFLAQRANVIGEPAPSMFEDNSNASNASRVYSLAAGLMAWALQSAQQSAPAMGSHNPRSTNEHVADLAQLKLLVVVEQWASATVRRFIEHHVANGSPHWLRSFSAQFAGSIHAGDQIMTQLTHVGM